MMSILVGGRIQEVAVMNQLSSNLHFMMVCFFTVVLKNVFTLTVSNLFRRHFINQKEIVTKFYMKKMHFPAINMQSILNLQCMAIVQKMTKL
jgi:hypothetical protein